MHMKHTGIQCKVDTCPDTATLGNLAGQEAKLQKGLDKLWLLRTYQK